MRALSIYLQDHLAGAKGAIELLEKLSNNKKDGSLAQFAAEILREIYADREQLEDLIRHYNFSQSRWKKALAWFTEKISRFKLGGKRPDLLEEFEALEALSLGITGKRALWKTLKQSAFQLEIPEFLDPDLLAGRAEQQYEQVEQKRLEYAARLF